MYGKPKRFLKKWAVILNLGVTWVTWNGSCLSLLCSVTVCPLTRCPYQRQWESPRKRGKWHFLPLPWLWLKVLAECFPSGLPCSHTFQEVWKTLNLSEDVPVSSCWELWTLRWVFPSSITQKQPKGREQLLLVRASPVAFCSYLFSFIFSGKRHISHTVNQFGLQCLLNWNFPITSTLWRKYSWKQETVRIILQLLCLKRWAVMGETVLLTLWSIPVVTALGLERKPDSPCNRRTHPNLLQVCTCSATHWHTVTVPWHSNTL